MIAVRCGGHSIPGLSTCDDGIVIDLSRMRSVEVDPERRVARISGGSLLGDLDGAAQEHGLVCPVGVVSHTGVAGLTLGGGMGRLQRKHGLTIDNLLAVELVMADGRLVRASEDEHPELFWGLRGAGSNFGIATWFEFRLHPLDHAITYGTVTHPLERARELAALWRELAENGPDELFLSFGVTNEDGAYVTALHSGPPDRGRARPGRPAGVRAADVGLDQGHDLPRDAAPGRRGAGVGPPLLHEERVPAGPARRGRGRARRARAARAG